MRFFFFIFFISLISFSTGQSLAEANTNLYIYNGTPESDSMHSSMILAVSYKSDTLYVKARHYAVCCEKFINYIEKKDNLSQINFVVKSLEKGCLCEVEKIITHKVYANNLRRNVKLRINGATPDFGIVEYLSQDLPQKRKKKRKKDKSKEL